MLVNRGGQTLCIALGGGLYWAASILFLTVWRPSLATAGGADSTTQALLWFLISAAIGATLAFHKQLMRPRFQCGLGLAAAAATAAYIALPALGLPDGVGAAVVLLANALHHALLIVFWGIVYTSLGKHEAERATALSALVALAAYFLCLLIPVGSLGAPIAAALRAVGVVPFLIGAARIPTLERAAAPDSLGLLVPFYLSRAFLGLCMAPLFFLAAAATDAISPSAPLCIAGLLGSAAAFGAMLLRKRADLSILRVAPIVLLGAVSLPYVFPLGSLGAALPLIAASIAWISWIALSAAQLSDIKERIGLDEAFLAISEKAVVITAIFLGFALCSLASAQAHAFPVSDLSASLASLPLYACLIVCCYQFAQLIERKQRQRLVKKGFMRSEDQVRMVHDALAKRYGLTEREKDVFVLMAAGHTRPRIREQLCISDGTVKTHAYHLYEKMGVHSREELYALVERERAKLADDEHIGLDDLA